MKTVIQIVLVIAIIILGYAIYESIQKPQRFNKEQERRYKRTIEKLKDIRTIQISYKAKHNRYTGSFDTLIDFVKYDSFDVVKAIGMVTDSMLAEGITEKKALQLGLITRDTSKVSVLDSLFDQNYPIDSIRYVPFTPGEEFFLGATKLTTASKVIVPVFEASVLNNVLLNGLEKQLIINFNEQREKITGFKGLRVGSLT